MIELEDQPWLPRRVRQGVTAYLNLLGNLTRAPYQTFCDTLAEALRRSGESDLIDLCSGSAGPLHTLLDELAQRGVSATALATDLYPDIETLSEAARRSGGRLRFDPAPVDATAVPSHHEGFRTLFNSFHHLAPTAAQAVLQDAVRQRRGIAIFEIVERRPLALIACALAVIGVPIATLFIRPWRWDRAILTYVLPVIPLVTAFDGLVSCMRVYSPDELRVLVDQLTGAEDYSWTIQRERINGSPMGVTWLIGAPAGADETPH